MNSSLGSAPLILSPAARAPWAKTDQEQQTDKVHPLVCHIMDTAAVAERLWQIMLSAENRRRIAKTFDLSEESAGRWVVFLAAVHDLGKACPGFQLGVLHNRGPISRDVDASAISRALGQAGLTAPSTLAPVPVLHAQVSHFALFDALLAQRVEKSVARKLAEVVGGHHGLFMTATAIHEGLAGLVGRDSRGDQTWSDVRRALVDFAASVAGIDWAAPPKSADDPATIAVITGIVTVADWIASNAALFPYATRVGITWKGDLDTYLECARGLADLAFTRLAWFGATPGDNEARSFAKLFDRTLRPFQLIVESLVHDTPPPGLLIIEAPTGEGKTEAAIFTADVWGIMAGHRGLYFALPTRATSEAIVERLFRYLGTRYDGETIGANLLHGRSALSPNLKQPRKAVEDFWPSSVGDRPAESVVAGRWFGRRRRGLLLPFGAGTVDQALMAAVGIKHSYVLMAALAGKTVVFDEVHAYDAIMSVRFDTLLRWLGAIGASAVVLSATLPDHKRRAFIQAYAEGAGWMTTDPCYAFYPRLTVTSAARAQTIHVPATDRGRGLVKIHQIEPTEVDGIIEDLLDGDGSGCIAVICHSVRQAQETYRRLAIRYPGLANDDEPVVDIFHARFPEDAKEERRRRVEMRFGARRDTKGATIANPTRPKRAILVATQIIEQSLDLDFDALVTPIAPIDLLIQRVGRVQRHSVNVRSPRFASGPEIWVTRTIGADDNPVFPSWETNIYSRHRLLRTFWTLRGRTSFSDTTEPETLVESVYALDDESGARALRAQLSDVNRATWDTTLSLEQRVNDGSANRARGGSIQGPHEHGSDLSLLTNREQDDGDDADDPESDGDEATTSTRDGDESLTIVLLCGDPDHPLLASPTRSAAWTSGDERTRPSIEELRELLGMSLVVRASVGLKRLDPLPGWKRIPALSHAHALFLDAALDATIGRTTFHLRSDVGLEQTSPNVVGGISKRGPA